MTAMLKSIFRRQKPVPQAAVESDDETMIRPIEWPLLRKMLQGLAPYKKQYALGICICWIQISMDMLGPQFVGSIVDFVGDFLSGRHTEGKLLVERVLHRITGMYDAAAVNTHQAVMYLMAIIGLWSAAIIISLITQRFVILIVARAGESVQLDYRKRIFTKMQQLDMGYYDRTKLGRMISRCTSDVNGMREANVWGPAHIIIQSSMIIYAAVAMATTSLSLFLAVAWIAIVLFFVNRYFIRRTATQWQVVREGFTRVSTNLAENITGMRVVTAFNRQDPNLETFNRLQAENTENNIQISRLNGTYQPSLEIIRYVGRFILLGYGGYLIVAGNLSLGGIVAAYGYWDWFMNPIVFLGTFYNTLMQALAGAERIFSLLETEPQVYDLPDAKPLPRITGDVTFENVTFGYNPDRPVLHDVSFEAKSGQMFALVGHTGSGKSSIISLIARFYQPQSGRVLVDGHDVRHVIGESLHKQMGLVLQVNYLFSGSVLDNIRYAKPDVTEQEVLECARDLGTYETIMNLKDGLHTDVGERGSNMSLGQRQLICFTRAYIADPRIFMLDEATSAVDTGTEMLVQKSLEKLLQNRTTFVVAHRLSTIMRADCILVIDQGNVIERGKHDDLIAQGGKYAHLYEQFARHSE